MIKESIKTVADLFAMPVIAQMPRLLTQVDRNPHSPTYGSCCRNYWHYRIEDISNSQFQELVLTLSLTFLYESKANPYYQQPKILAWIQSIILFWTQIQNTSGSFDEVYQGHDSYAATAFTAFTISETLIQLGAYVDQQIFERGMKTLTKAANWLCKTDEQLTVNQIAGAVAALYNIATLTNSECFTKQAESLLEKIKNSQSEEGWFLEYGGADIGYGSLTQSFLALIYKRTGNEHSRQMALKSINFLQYFLHRDGTVGGEYGSRNTEYFIPLGAILLAEESPVAKKISQYLSYQIKRGRHNIVTHCLDDRYFVYLSPYYMLAAHFILVEGCDFEIAPSPSETHNLHFSECQLWIFSNPQYQFFGALAKGGIFRCEFSDNCFLDEGIFGQTISGQLFTSQQLNLEKAKIQVTNNTATIHAGIYIQKPIVISPWQNILVKTYNLIMPELLRRIFLDFLRKRAVSGGRQIGQLTRSFFLHEDAVEIKDIIRFSVPIRFAELQLDKERAFSFASTGFFQVQELKTKVEKNHLLPTNGDQPIKIHRVITKDGVQYLTNKPL